jgi:hypothetical protein
MRCISSSQRVAAVRPDRDRHDEVKGAVVKRKWRIERRDEEVDSPKVLARPGDRARVGIAGTPRHIRVGPGECANDATGGAAEVQTDVDAGDVAAGGPQGGGDEIGVAQTPDHVLGTSRHRVNAFGR